MIEYGRNHIGEGSVVFDDVTLGFPSRARFGQEGYTGATIGDRAIIRSGTIIYCDVVIGDDFQTGHRVLIRENTTIGDRVAVGSSTIIEGATTIGSRVSIQSLVYIPTDTVIGDDVFIGPNAVLTNDRYPPHGAGSLAGPVIRSQASIGANATLLPGITVGEGSLVAAGAVVTKDVPPATLAIGAPARFRPLPAGARP
ncbi:MAG: acetyltransferase [Methanoculleus sp. SDB]|nr:MAG: acetyltransferase [Methanoculleus sp. SDB]